jgi:hypothetical protein
VEAAHRVRRAADSYARTIRGDEALERGVDTPSEYTEHGPSDRTHSHYLSRWSDSVGADHVVAGWDPGCQSCFAHVFKPGDDEPTYWLGVTQSLTTIDDLAHALGLYRSVALALRDELEKDRAWAVRLYGPRGGPPTRDPMSAKLSPAYWTPHARHSSRNGKRRAAEGGRTSAEQPPGPDIRRRLHQRSAERRAAIHPE